MGKYSIKELEALTGIKAHTLRIWEKRHNLIQPTRTDTNIRLYSDQDLKQILNVSILYNQGFKISRIASLTEEQLIEKINELSSQAEPEAEVFIDQFTVSMVEMDERKFNNLLTQCIAKYGFEPTMTDIIYPFLRKIGVLWLSDNINPAQEHFISNLIRQKLVTAIDGLGYEIDEQLPVVLLFLPEGEMHEIGLLFFHYLIKKKGYKTYYLGQNVPFPDVKRAADATNADMIVGAVSYVASDKHLEDFLAIIDETFQGKQILLTGQPLFDKRKLVPESISLFKTPAELKDLI